MIYIYRWDILGLTFVFVRKIIITIKKRYTLVYTMMKTKRDIEI